MKEFLRVTWQLVLLIPMGIGLAVGILIGPFVYGLRAGIENVDGHIDRLQAKSRANLRRRGLVS
jgi:hypothetical protein